MAFVNDPYSGLHFLELSHVWGHGVPSYPGQDDVSMKRAVKHAQHGVLAWRIKTSMHTGTHLNAPIHLIQRGQDLAQLSLENCFGNGVVLDIPKDSYETISSEDLKLKDIKEGDIVVINTGWHNKYSDGLEYYGEAPGLTKEAAEYLVSLKCKLVAMDTPHIDHPLATSMGPHRGGPQMKRLAKAYTDETGLDPKVEHGEWNIAHKTLLGAGIPTIEQVGGDVDLLNDKRATFAALPWKISHGEACQIRFIAIVDPNGESRIDSGKETE